MEDSLAATDFQLRRRARRDLGSLQLRGTGCHPLQKRRATFVDSSSAAVAASAHGEAHNPAVLHHFAEPQQQRDAASLGMWVFLATEVMFFGGLFCAYLVYRRLYFGDFAAAR